MLSFYDLFLAFSVAAETRGVRAVGGPGGRLTSFEGLLLGARVSNGKGLYYRVKAPSGSRVPSGSNVPSGICLVSAFSDREYSHKVLICATAVCK